MRLRSGDTSHPIGFKPSVFDKVVDTTTCMSRIFDICDQRSGQFRDLTITYKSMGKNSNSSYWMIMSQNDLNPS